MVAKNMRLGTEMALVQIKIPNQLLIPFGGPKWSIERISVVGVSTTGTYIQSDTPLAYIDRSKNVPVCLSNFKDFMPGDWPDNWDVEESLAIVERHLDEKCEVDTPSEHKFLDLYFQFVRDRVKPPSYYDQRKDKRSEWAKPYNDDDWVFEALMPMPQAHLYQSDPFVDTFSFAPNRMMKVDFAFWTGKRLVAVEIDGGSHVGSEKHIEKDRMLQRAGVHVVHILNSEIERHGMKVIKSLLPNEVTEFWKLSEGKVPTNPFNDIPF